MQRKMGQIRLYIPQQLAPEESLFLDEKQSHYLSHVMKIKEKEQINCFDNQSGEYLCEITEITKKHCGIKVIKQLKPYYQTPDIWLLFSPVKKDNTDFILQKATELGVRQIVPVITRYTITDKINKERFVAQTIEASEQCRRTDLPKIEDAIRFERLLEKWDKNRKIYYMDETLKGVSVQQAFEKKTTPCAIMVGPEGGFAAEELEQLRKQKFTQGVMLGPRILRAETAVVAALSCWQGLNGDWK